MNLKVVLKKLIPIGMFQRLAPAYHYLEARVASQRYGNPARELHVIGVTGTNGKTTTSFMIHRMLVEAGYNVALMTTVGNGVRHDIQPQVAHMTTVSAPELQRRLRDFCRQGAEWVVLETTSHALAQHRVWGVPYEIAVMTNVTHEHLDYHGTFERYRDAKRRLFQIAARHGRRFGVVNADDPSAHYFSREVPRSITYGIQHGELRARDIKQGAKGSRFRAVIDGDEYDITCQIPGEFNVSNSLAAVAVGRELGLTRQQIESGIAALKEVEGRMNTISEDQAYGAVVDFAHTPDSFERLLGDLRRSTQGKLVVVFGSAGRRDEAKRAIQGEIAGTYADEVVLTEEDDRDVDGHEILEMIASGAQKAGKIRGKNLFLILDRTEAIHTAVTRVASAQDTVVFLGKGHEKTIERADGEHPWNELETVRQAIRAHRSNT